MVATKKKGNYPGKRAKTAAFKKQRFLEEFAKCANLSSAAKYAGVNRNIHYEWLREDPDYVAAFDIAHKQACDAIDQEIYRRGAKGFLEPVFYQGKKVADVRKYDSTLLIFFAKGLMAEKYRENFKGELTHTGVMAVSQGPDLSKLSDEQWSTIKSVLGPALDGPPVAGLPQDGDVERDPGGGPEEGEK